MFLPEIDVEIGMGTLGGRFTTIDGLLTQLKSEFESTPFLQGDSADPAQRVHVERVFGGIDKVFSYFLNIILCGVNVNMIGIIRRDTLHHHP